VPDITLITIPISHYGERARWALDAAGLSYREVHHLQMFSWIAARRAGGRKMLPVVTIGDRALVDSADVVRFAADERGVPLYPDASRRSAVEALERRFAGDFGVATRLCAYDWLFRGFDAALPYNFGRAPAYQVGAMSALRRPARLFAKRYLGVQPAALVAARDRIARVLDEVAERLRDGRRHLDGDVFTAADLTFAAMAAPAVLPARYGVRLPDPATLPPDATASIAAARAHEAGRYVLSLYEARPPVRATYDRAPHAA
jgi:glutathione S-transferase